VTNQRWIPDTELGWRFNTPTVPVLILRAQRIYLSEKPPPSPRNRHAISKKFAHHLVARRGCDITLYFLDR
jgi:hypothetical protein